MPQSTRPDNQDKQKGPRGKGSGKPGLETRIAATKLLSAIIDKKTSMDGLTDPKGGNPAFLALSQQDRLLVKAILLSVLRHYQTIDAFIDKLLDKPLPHGAVSLRRIIEIGAAQIIYLDVPDHSAVDLAVEQANADPRNKRFAKLVNAILRRMSREKKKRMPGFQHKIVNLPPWFYDRMIAHYGADRARDMADLMSEPAPIDLTVKSDAKGWADKLGGVVLADHSIRLEKLDGPIQSLEGFEAGQWWVQDVAASLPARLFGDLTGQRVVDLCAAPGGKTAQLILAGAKVTALDRSKSRLNRLQENLDRLQLQADLQMSKMEEFKPDALYDAALLDAPCSSTGTMRRHPDIVWTKNADDITYLAGVQKQMLAHAIKLVRPGGLIVFSNCSMEPEEGEHMMEAFLDEYESDVSRESPDPTLIKGFEHAITEHGFIRTTPEFKINQDPDLIGLDGFFATILKVK